MMIDLSTQSLSHALALGMLGLGFLVGAYGTLIGAGGGFLLVPLLLLVSPNLTPASVTSMSLAVVFFNAYAGTWAYARMGRIDYGAGLLFAVAGVPGALLGAWAVTSIPRQPFEVVFGLLLLALGLFLVFHPLRQPLLEGPPDARGWQSHPRMLAGSVGSAYLGVLASLLGIGGGILHVPFLIRVLSFPPHIATATAHFVLTIVALTATLLHWVRGELDSVLVPTALLALGVMMGAPVGATISGLFRGPLLVRLLALALCAFGVRLLWRLA
jgi:uncharacterized membrane protein YfcA